MSTAGGRAAVGSGQYLEKRQRSQLSDVWVTWRSLMTRPSVMSMGRLNNTGSSVGFAASLPICTPTTPFFSTCCTEHTKSWHT
eukprot:50244-Eustigmatos_ZCMA.PRE.1